MKLLMKLFAKGMYCPKCNHPMQMREETFDKMKEKWEVYYVCPNCKTAKRVYE